MTTLELPGTRRLDAQAAAPSGPVRRGVLLVEDNPSHARLVREMLAEGTGHFNVLHRRSLSDISVLDAAEAECVLLDLSLPDATGAEALHALWRKAPHIPVVVLSGRIDEDIALDCVREGAQDYLPKSELAPSLLTRALNYAIERKRLESQLAHQALHDGLTGLPNRALLTDRVERALLGSRRQGRAVGLLFIDLDGFKAINDGHGHAAGDRLLQAVAQRLLEVLGADDTLARTGGDEFCVLAPELHDVSDAVGVGRQVAQALDVPLPLGAQAITVTASIGVAVATGPAADAESLLRAADTAMHRAKRNGKDRLEVARPADADDLDGPGQESALRHAIENGQLRLHYQPIFSLHDGGLAGAEALVRWQHPARGLLGPDEFVPLAERSGLIVPLGSWVLDEACRQTASWLDGLGQPFEVGVNLSAAQLSHHDLAGMVGRGLLCSGLDPAALTLEVTETAIMTDLDACLRSLEELAGLGVTLSIDDFGTGYSSLAYLCQLPASVVKVDRSFVSALGQPRAREHQVVSAVVALAHQLGQQVVAEGVETAAELEAVTRLGCDLAQGFLLGHPMPAAAFAASLRGGPWRLTSATQPEADPARLLD